MSTQSQALRALLQSPRCEYLLETHSALSAKIAEEAGAPGLWASSLTLSSTYGLRDNSELTMTQVLDVLESITSRVAIPVLFDGDTGYGQFSHFQQLVRRLCARGVAGVCIEDKVFPKTNSFLRSESQSLAPVEEFCGKIRAGKDAQPDPAFVVVARTEALVTGLDIADALDRARRYADAGADAVLVHSKDRTFAPIREFMRRWEHKTPVVCVPTTYYGTPPEAFDEAGVALVIWANHLLRASLTAMQDAARRIVEARSGRDVEDHIAPMSEVFRLQDTHGLEAMERVYGHVQGTRAVILAASRGEELGALTADRPKCMVPVGGVPVVEKLIRQLRAEGIREISLVRGYCKDAVRLAEVSFHDNDAWADSGELVSLAAARPALEGDIVIAYGDLLVRRYIVHELLASDAPVTLVVDGTRGFLATGKPAPDRVRASGGPGGAADDEERHLVHMGPDVADSEAHGEWIGLCRVRGRGTAALRDALDEQLAEPAGRKASMDALFNRLVAKGVAIRVVYVTGGWVDIDTLPDIAQDAVD